MQALYLLLLLMDLSLLRLLHGACLTDQLHLRAALPDDSLNERHLYGNTLDPVTPLSALLC